MQRGGRGGGFRGGGRSFGGGGRGGGGRGFGGGRGGGRGFQDYGPPSEVTEAGIFEHPCEGEAVCKLSIDKVGLTPQSTSWTECSLHAQAGAGKSAACVKVLHMLCGQQHLVTSSLLALKQIL